MEAVVHAWLHPESALGHKLPDPILAAVPGFMALILIELVISILRGKKVYNLRQTVSNLSAGVFLTLMGTWSGTRPGPAAVHTWTRFRHGTGESKGQARHATHASRSAACTRHPTHAVVFVKAMYIFPYAWLRSKLTIIPSAPEYTWLHNVVGVILVDHAYYWWVGRGVPGRDEFVCVWLGAKGFGGLAVGTVGTEAASHRPNGRGGMPWSGVGCALKGAALLRKPKTRCHALCAGSTERRT